MEGDSSQDRAQAQAQHEHPHQRKKPQRNWNRDKQDGRHVVSGSVEAPNVHQNRRDKEEKRSARSGTGKGKNAERREAGGSRRPRGANFNAGLTPEASAPTTDDPASATGKSSSRTRYQSKKQLQQEIEGDNLTSNLIRGLQVPPYLDCPICFNAIHPPQPTWSCSPNIPVVSEEKSEHQPQYCWTTFHLKCIRPWAEKSYKEVKAAWVARGEMDKDGEWRCPGCQGRRHRLIGGYICFCGSTPSPNSRLATPHSCGNPCSRPRATCSHPCPLLCHPGPCPPCKITMEIPCGCGRNRTVPVRCGESTQVSCGEVCSKLLGCGKHRCEKTCHLGECEPCVLKEAVRCWCGKHEREGMCGEGGLWMGLVGCDANPKEYMNEMRKGFACDDICGKPYDCGKHFCTKPCHPPSSTIEQSHCLLSLDRITTCPCGKWRFLSSSSVLPKAGEFPAREKCTDLIPTCSSPCLKPHASCEHTCQSRCHTGDCPPCSVEVTRPCRCGGTVQTVKCGELHVVDEAGLSTEREVLCDKPCNALRACGKHQCNRLCCPLASLGAAAKGKGKNRAFALDALGDAGGLHGCDLVCGKPLSCRIHTCEERDHRGPCKPCLRSSFEELICSCGRTVLEPPIPCGTKVHCPFPCPRLPLPCGHPKTAHTCHADGTPCPPCVVLTAKLCACGKKEIPNKHCSLERAKVGCGQVCGKLLECGYHRCDRTCHADECWACTSMCGKARKHCLPDQHPCTHLCHAPAICPEDEPCQSLVSLSCPCGRISLSVLCGKSFGNPAGSSKSQQQPKCTTDCEVAKRNAKLAEALRISPDRVGGASQVAYSEDLVTFGRVNGKFLALVEKAFTDFVTSSRTSQVLPHTPSERRKFVHDLASVYRLDTQMVDQEPYRSVEIIRRIDTRIPNPLLSAYISSFPSRSPSLGKLANLRGGRINSPSWRSNSSSPVARPTPTTGTTGNSASTSRGWSSVVGAGGSVKQSVKAPSSGTAWNMGAASTSTSRDASAPTSRMATPPAASAALTTTVSVRPRSAASSSNEISQPQVENQRKEDVPDDWEDDA